MRYIAAAIDFLLIVVIIILYHRQYFTSIQCFLQSELRICSSCCEVYKQNPEKRRQWMGGIQRKQSSIEMENKVKRDLGWEVQECF